MANTFNASASSTIKEISIVHNEVTDFVTFLRDTVQPAIGTSYNQVLNIPAKATRLINAKTRFDSLSIPGATVTSILEKLFGYGTWTATHTTDLNSIVTKAGTLRGLIESNVGQFPASYNVDHQLEYVTANAATQTALNNQINDILTHVA